MNMDMNATNAFRDAIAANLENTAVLYSSSQRPGHHPTENGSVPGKPRKRGRNIRVMLSLDASTSSKHHSSRIEGHSTAL